MKICTHCGKQNPGDASYCYACGNPVKNSFVLPQKTSFWSRLPSWAWIFIGLAAIALLLGFIIGGFWALANVEGIASLIFLVAGVVCFGVFSGRPATWPPLLRAIGIGFFALMGATVDQTGNVVYNKPVEICLCPPGTKLERTTVTSHPYAGRTDMTQDFTCVKNMEAIKALNPFAIMGIRFLEYMMLAYILLGVRWLIWKLKSNGS
jgi:hypothetical protein